MDYRKIYENLIIKASNRVVDGYTERHHIIPDHFFINRSRKGKPGWLQGDPNSKDNIIRLTPEEHFLAHQLLVKIYPEHISLICAVVRMTKKGEIRNNKMFGWIRRRHAAVMTELKSSMSREELKLSNDRRKATRDLWTDEQRKVISKKKLVTLRVTLENRTEEEIELTRIRKSRAGRLSAEIRKHNGFWDEESRKEAAERTRNARAKYTEEQNVIAIEKQKASKAARTQEQKDLTNLRRAETFAKKTLAEIEETNRQRNETHAKRRAQLMRSTDSDKD